MEPVIISGKRVTFRQVHWRQFMRDAEGAAEEYCALARHLSDTEIEVTISSGYAPEQQFVAVAQMMADLQNMFAPGRELLRKHGLSFNDENFLGLPFLIDPVG